MAFKTILNGYMCFHGWNQKNWKRRNSRDKFDYLYHEDVLAAYKSILMDLTGKAKLLQVYFNNHAKGSSGINTQKM